MQGVGGTLHGQQGAAKVLLLVVGGHHHRDPVDAVSAGQRQGKGGHLAARVRHDGGCRPRIPDGAGRDQDLQDEVAFPVQPCVGPAELAARGGVDGIAVELPAGDGVPPVAQGQGTAGQECGLDPLEQLSQLAGREVVAHLGDHDQVEAAIRPVLRDGEVAGPGCGQVFEAPGGVGQRGAARVDGQEAGAALGEFHAERPDRAADLEPAV